MHMQKRCCIIDRCNFDAAQRAPWIRIANKRDVPCFALWLNLPIELVCERAGKRMQHEGGVVGDMARGLASQTQQRIVSMF